MFIKGKGFYLALPLFVVILAKMLHPILYVFLIFYFIFMYLKHFKILLSVSLLLSFLLFLFRIIKLEFIHSNNSSFYFI